MVDKDSAILNESDEQSCPLDADHQNICKFHDRKDPNYAKVRGTLSMWTEELARASSTDSTLPTTTVSTEPGQAGSLYSDEISKIKHVFGLLDSPDTCVSIELDRHPTRLSAGGWLFDSPNFQEWSQGRNLSPSFLLIGPPGTGKSVICRAVSEYLTAQSEMVYYYRFDKTHHLLQTGSLCLRSIAAQIAFTNSTFRKDVLHLHESTGLGFDNNSSFQTIWESVFEGILFKLELPTPIYIVLDSIDESDSARSILQKLSSIQHQGTIRIFATCRPIKEAPNGNKDGVFVHFVHAEDTAEDMREYIRDTIQGLLPDDLHTRQLVESKIMEKAAGSFLWAKLALELIQDSWHTEEDIISCLNQVPPGMTAMYSRMIGLLENSGERTVKLAKDILSWVVSSWRPLYITELAEALKPTYGAFTNLSLTITQICGHFIIIDRREDIGPKAILIHLTAREFLTGSQDGGIPWISSKQAHQAIARACLNYLCDESWRAQLSSLGGLSRIAESPNSAISTNRLLTISSSFPLLPYASWNWAYHLMKSPSNSTDLLEILEVFMLSHSLAWIEAIALSRQMNHVVRSAGYLKLYVKKASKVSWNETRWILTWATDFIRIASKFAANLVINPSSVHRNIPPLCPKRSMIGKAFSTNTPNSILVSGLSMENWDDCLASVVIDNSEFVASVLANGDHFFTRGGFSHNITIWNAETCERTVELQHGEWVSKMAVHNSGASLASETKNEFHIWSTQSGDKVCSFRKSARSPVHHLTFGINGDELIAVYENFKIERFDLTTDTAFLQELDVSKLDTGYQNCPFCQSISPDGTKIAMGWRGRPPLVWDLRDGYNTCPLKCRSNSMAPSIMTTRSLTWHPSSTKLYVVCQDDTVYEWNIFNDELFELSCVKARHLALSVDGSLLLASDHEGTINIFSLPRLSLIYSLQKSGDLVNAIAFSSDNQRFYDIRNGSSCNIWEPDALIRGQDFGDEDRSSLSESLSSAEAVISTQRASGSTVTAISAGPTPDVYACAREDGAITIHSVLNGEKLRKVYQRPASLRISVLEWSKTGKYMASCDSSSQLVVKKLVQKEDDKWAVFPTLDFRLNDAAPEVSFSTNEKYLMVKTPTNLEVWNLKTKSKVFSRPKAHTEAWYWTSLATKPNTVFCFDTYGCTIGLDAETGSELTFPKPSGLLTASTSPPEPPLTTISGHVPNSATPSASKSRHIIWSSSINRGLHRLIATTEDENGRWASLYCGLRLKIVKVAPGDTSMVEICPELCKKIKLLLGVIGNDLIFLGFDGWVCSHNVTSLLQPNHERRLSTGVMTRKEDLEGFRRHFYIPRDWLRTTSANAIANNDGTLLFPFQGEVAIVRNGLRF